MQFNLYINSSSAHLKLENQNSYAIFGLYPDLSELVINFEEYPYDIDIDDFEIYAVLKDKNNNILTYTGKVIDNKIHVIIKNRVYTDTDTMQIYLYDTIGDEYSTLNYPTILKYRNIITY